MKTLSSSNRFSFICFLFILSMFILTILLNHLLPLFEGTFLSNLSTYQTLIAIPASFMYMLLFILPGFLATQLLISKKLVKRKYLLLAAVLLSSLLAYIIFWVYFFNNNVGIVVSIAIILSSIILFVLRFKSLKEYILEPLFIRPLTIVFIVGCLYFGILLLYAGGNIVSGDLSAIAGYRFTHRLAVDNVIPRWFFELVYKGEELYYVDGFYWLVSDRPPLATAIMLLMYPINIFSASYTVFYQFFGTYIQLLWIPALYCLCDFFSLTQRVRNFIITSAVFSGVFIMNSVFLWPKLSTTIYFCLLLFLTFDLVDEKRNTFRIVVSSILIGISAAMAYLTHGSIVFSFIALALAILVCEKRFKYNYKDLLYAFGSFVVVYIPWYLFSNSIDPMGGKLPKLHLAGIGMEHLTLTEALSKYYSETSFGDVVLAKLTNITDMFPTDIAQFMSIDSIRWNLFTRIFSAPAFLIIFLIIAILYFIYRYCFKKEKLDYEYKIMLWLTVFSFTVWPILMHSRAIVYHGSMFNLILIYFLIAFGVKHTKDYIARPIFFANIIFFVSVFVLDHNSILSESMFHMSRSMVTITILSAAAYFVYTYLFDKDLPYNLEGKE